MLISALSLLSGGTAHALPRRASRSGRLLARGLAHAIRVFCLCRAVRCALGLAVCGAALALFACSKGGAGDGALTLYGNVDIRQIALAFEGSGRVLEMAVDEGARVQAGQTLAVLDTQTLALQAAQARAQIEAQRQSLRKLESGTRPQEVAQAQSRVAAARATLAHEGAAGESGARAPQPVLSPVSGVVLRRSLQSATPVAAGQSLMEVGDTAQLEIEAEVLSTDAVRLAPGMTARVLRWGGEGALQARVTRVEPGGFTKVSALGVQEQRTRVILELTSPRADWAALGDAWRVETEFITRQEENAVQVPASALFRTAATEGGAGSTGGWALYVVENGRARLTPVRIGLRSDAAAQILEGAAPGQTVILQPDDRIHDGVRIQPA